MKKVAQSLVAMVVISNLGFAGGDIEQLDTALVIDSEVSPFYVGLGLSSVSTRSSEVGLGFLDDQFGEDDTGDILLMAGYEFNQYIAVEGRYMTSVWGEDSLSRDSWGIYVKPQYPATEAFTLYALLGYGGLNVDGKGPSIVKVDDTGFQWGLGASYDLNAYFSIFVDYVNVANDMDVDIVDRFYGPQVDSDAISVGVTYSF